VSNLKNTKKLATLQKMLEDSSNSHLVSAN